MKKNISLQLIDPKKYLNEISQCCIEGYGKEPWNEHYICEKCIDPNDFDPQIKYKNFGNCPIHHTPLKQFWSIDRTRRYIEQAVQNQSFKAFGAICDGRLLGFFWGFHKEVKGLSTFYLDVIFVDPQERRGKGSISLVDILVVLESRGFSLASWILSQIDLPLFVQLYRHHLVIAQQLGFDGVSTRTSIQHPYLQSRLRIMGYDMAGQSQDDTTRAYFVLRRSS